MVWLFEREDVAIRIETRFEKTTAEYLLIVQRGDVRDIERFGDPAAFRRRLEQLEQELDADRWKRTGPFFLKDGWRL